MLRHPEPRREVEPATHDANGAAPGTWALWGDFLLAVEYPARRAHVIAAPTLVHSILRLWYGKCSKAADDALFSLVCRPA